MAILFVGIDLAKNVFAVHGVDEYGKAVLVRPAVQRAKLHELVKSEDEQAGLCVHRVRQGFVEQRTATINRLRGLLSEFGIVLPQKAAIVRRQATAHLEDLRAGPIRRSATR